MPPRFTLTELASRVGGRLRGDPETVLTGLKTLDEAGPEDLSFLVNPRYRKAAAACAAGVLLTSERLAPPRRALLLVQDPYMALAELLPLFYPEATGFDRPSAAGAASEFSEQAIVSPSARLGSGISLGPLAIVDARCVIGDGARIGAGVILGEECEVGDGTVLHARVTVYPGTKIGRRVIVHSGAVLGSDGFGFATSGGKHRKIPQVGSLRIEDDVEIGANVTIDRASLGTTVIGRGTKIDNLVQVAHNVRIGEDSILAAQSGIAGSTRLGQRVTLAGQSGVAGHLVIGDEAIVASKSAGCGGLSARSFVAGIPATDHRVWKRAQAVFTRLPELRAELRALRRRLEELERRVAGREER